MSVAGKFVAAAIVLGTLAGIAWFVWWQQPTDPPAAAPTRAEAPRSVAPPTTAQPLFRCDARTQCEQMTSCEEAMFFLKNCPTKNLDLDQDKDGIPCEIQWCQK